MRIIGGNLKGRQLAAVKGHGTRPTADRIREALFNILGPRVANAVTLDLFAGTGALGIEALSRGARWATFVDRDRHALTTLRQNIQRCRLEGCIRVYQWNAARNLNCLKPVSQPYDLVFLDPPYHQDLVPRALAHLIDIHGLASFATVVAEHASNEAIRPPEGLTVTDRRTYGQTGLTFLTPSADHPE